MKPLVIMVLVAAFSSLPVAVAETMIGNCNRTFFAHGATVCQRAAAENLVLVEDSSCESVYKQQISCLTQHVKKCVAGNALLEIFSPAVVDLFKHVVINCGSVSGIVNPLLLDQLKCPKAAGAFTQSKNCWTEFASKVKTNKKDPALCSVYHQAKLCVTNITNVACPEVNLEKDHCNPFCANGTDDHRECRAIPISLKCTREFYFEKEKDCEEKFMDRVAGSDSSSCSTEIPKLVTCVKDQYKECFFPRVDNALLEKLEDAIVRTSSAQRLFCNTTPLNVSALSSTLRDIIACNADFYTNAENCVKDFREAYTTKKDNATLCRKFASAKSCLYQVQKDHCQHNSVLLQMANSTNNPYSCEDQPKDPTGGSEVTMCSGWLTIGVMTTLFVLQKYFLSG